MRKLCVLGVGAFSIFMSLMTSAYASSDVNSDPDKIKAQRIIQIVSAAKEKYGLPSAMVSVWIGNKEIVNQALGYSMTGVKATQDMHFRMGAVTISYLSTLLLQLVDQGKVSLDDKLSKWFPEYPDANKITLRMLANSSAGYADYVYVKAFDQNFSDNVFKDFSYAQIIQYSFTQPLAFQPGTSWGYSHTDFVVLGKVLEKITGQTIDQLLQKNIFSKLNLRNTQFASTPEIQLPVLHAFTSERGVYEDSTYWNPSWTSYLGKMTSNMQDLSIWTRAFGTGKLISPRSYQAMLDPVTAHLGKSGPDLYYGLGVIVANPWIFQYAQFGGYHVIMAYLPSDKIAIDIVTTQGEKSPSDVSYVKEMFKNLVKYLAPDHLLPERI